MAQKVYKVTVWMGRKHKVVFETQAFEDGNWDADFKAFHEAQSKKEEHSMILWKENKVGKVEVDRCTK